MTIMWKNTAAGQATDGNLAHALCMMDSYGYKHPHRICHTDCFFTATMDARTRLVVTSHVYCLSCWHTCHHTMLFVTKISCVCSAQQGLDVVELQWKTYTTKPVKSPKPSILEIIDLALKQEYSPFRISLFHRAFFNSIMYKTPTHALFHSTLYYSSALITLKYTKIFNSTPTCFDLKRSSSGIMTVPC